MHYAMLIGGNEKLRQIFKESAIEDGAIGTWDLDKGELPPKEIIEEMNKSFNEEYKNR